MFAQTELSPYKVALAVGLVDAVPLEVGKARALRYTSDLSKLDGLFPGVENRMTRVMRITRTLERGPVQVDDLLLTLDVTPKRYRYQKTHAVVVTMGSVHALPPPGTCGSPAARRREETGSAALARAPIKPDNSAEIVAATLRALGVVPRTPADAASFAVPNSTVAPSAATHDLEARLAALEGAVFPRPGEILPWPTRNKIQAVDRRVNALDARLELLDRHTERALADEAATPAGPDGGEPAGGDGGDGAVR